MADSSSTSNSDPRPPIRFGVPWGLIGAIVLIVAVEAALRLIGPIKLIAFASDEGQYRAVRDFIDAQGPADVALIGSSQFREAIAMPRLTESIEKYAGHDIWAANYSMRGARVDVLDAAVRYLLRQPRPPKLIIVGFSPRDLRAKEPDWPRVAIFWTPADWLREFREHREVLSVMPIVVRNEAGRGLWSLRYREEISLWVQRHFARLGVDASEDRDPIIGEMTAQHVGPKGLAYFEEKGVSKRRLFDRVADSYLFDQPPTPPAQMQQRLVSLASQFDRADCRGLWIEMPVAAPLAERLKQTKLKSAFETAVHNAIVGRPIDYIVAEDRPVQFDKTEFRDLQHLNLPGAQRMSDWVASEIVSRVKPNQRSTTQPSER